MDDERRVVCRENQCLVDYLLQKKREQVDKPEGLSVNMERTFVKAYRNVCDSKDPISTLKDLFHIKGFGKWMLTLMKGYFDNGTASSGNVQKAKERKRYIPQRNSAAYGLLITLHRGTQNVKDFMRKQDLIDATDASGLSHASIAPEKGKGKIGLGLSKREYYSGWSCMTTLIHKGLVIKYSNPAKYKLTVQGREVADECIMRSGLSINDEIDIAQTHAHVRSKADSSAGTSRAQTCEVDILTDDEMDIAQPYTHPKSKEHFSAGTSRAQTCMVFNNHNILYCCVRDISQSLGHKLTGHVDLERSRFKKFRSSSDGYTLTPRSSSSSHAFKDCSSSVCNPFAFTRLLAVWCDLDQAQT
ncbi:crossover junction endonuclease MUS81-like isoform X1 [Raphanus sativus]|uniref:Crossover junction endonuclease MUS81 n=1 Tax=Raphanus sativus TaxID=3726 RepID=A0A9W3D7K2_RAPSA|nr:crossover junction endonuclease MUS81-like isoform X1 [Raphanus sativus]